MNDKSELRELLRELAPHMQWFLDKIRAASPEELRETHWMSAYSTRKANDLCALLWRIDTALAATSGLAEEPWKLAVRSHIIGEDK